MSKTILIPVDFSAHAQVAINYAATLVSYTEAKLVLFFANNGKTDLDEAKGKLQAIVDRLKSDHNVAAEYVIKKGKVANKLLKYSKEIDPSHIVIGMVNKEGANEFLGSMTYRIISRTDIPVVTLSKLPENGFKTIVVPIDLTVASRQKIGRLVKMAKHYEAQLKLVLLDDGEDRKKLIILGQMSSKFLAERKVEHTMDIIKVEDPEEGVIKYAKKVNADLVALMTHEEMSMMEYFVGTTAQNIINKMDLPVISFRPVKVEGFTYF